jgi:hypothetical protein
MYVVAMFGSQTSTNHHTLGFRIQAHNAVLEQSYINRG